MPAGQLLLEDQVDAWLADVSWPGFQG